MNIKLTTPVKGKHPCVAGKLLLIAVLSLLCLLSGCVENETARTPIPCCTFSKEELLHIFSMTPEKLEQTCNLHLQEASASYYMLVSEETVQLNDGIWLLGFNVGEDGTICDVVYAHSWRQTAIDGMPLYVDVSEAPLTESLRSWFKAEDQLRAVGTVQESYPHLPAQEQVSDELVEQTSQTMEGSGFSMTSFGPYQLADGLWATGNHQYSSPDEELRNGWVFLTFSDYDHYEGRGLHES